MTDRQDALLCCRCKHFFDPATGELIERFNHLHVESGSKAGDICKPCRKGIEDAYWGTTSNARD